MNYLVMACWSLQVFLLGSFAINLAFSSEESDYSSDSFEYLSDDLQSSLAETKKTEFVEILCIDGHIAFKEDIMKQLGACKPKCRHFCHIKVFNLMNDKGLPDPDLHSQWVAERFPEKYKNFSTNYFQDCFKKYGNKIDLSDKECKIADQMADCVWGIVPHIVT